MDYSGFGKTAEIEGDSRGRYIWRIIINSSDKGIESKAKQNI